MNILRRPLFYFDKDCIETSEKHVKKKFEGSGFTGVITLVCSPSYNAISKKEGKEFISYHSSILGDYVENKLIEYKIDEELRSFEWESIGVTGFEESILIYCTEEKFYKDEKQC